MNIPKQSMPVTRILPSISYSSQFGVSPSMKPVDKIKQFFRGSCSCDPPKLKMIDPLGSGELVPVLEATLKSDRCKAGYSPKCKTNGECRCEDNRRGQVVINPTTQSILNI
jgi:hypothetical protein